MLRILPAAAAPSPSAGKPPPTQRWPLHNSRSSRAAETALLASAATQAGRPSPMQQAGLAVARLALAVAPHAQQVLVLAGPGNNGGDGLEAAHQLLLRGKAVQVLLAADPAGLPADASAALQRALAAGVPVRPMPMDGQWPHRPDLVIDALLGLGSRRAPEGAVAAGIALSQQQDCPVLAVDLPSGLHPDTGQWLGMPPVVASHTLCLLTLKPGLFTGQGRDHAGTVWLDTLGHDPNPGAPDAWLTIAPAQTPARRHQQHKGSFGDLLVVGGAAGMAGAALLAARAAHAAGAGRVLVSPLDPTATGGDPLRPELMFRPCGWTGPEDGAARLSVVCGCGGGERVAAALPHWLQHAPRLVLDADALNAIAQDPALRHQLQQRAAAGWGTVLTPHPLEAARLLGCSTGEVQADRLAAAQRLAEQTRAVVVLKGSGSIVAAPGQVPWVNGSGNAALATAGTGDVLAGWLGGRWSVLQSGSPTAPSDQGPQREPDWPALQRLAAEAVWAHGAAADQAGLGLLRAADLVDHLARLG